MKTLPLAILISLAASCSGQKKQITQEDKDLLKSAQGLFKALPDSIIDQKKEAHKIKLGEKLYFETKLSKNGTMSCNSCHLLNEYGADGKKTSPGFDGKVIGDRNSPTVYNAALHTSQFWDGRAKDVEEQALGPILNPVEMAIKDEKEALSRIDTKEYADLFKNAFPKEKNPRTFKNIGNAIGAFERTLLTPSRFDDYLKGDIHALSELERQGLKKFTQVGCTSCHNGVAIGGNSLQKLGLVKPFTTKDLGLYNVTKKSRDKYKFKVQSLRNIEKTAPYFHNGEVSDLDEAIILMARHQLGKELNSTDVKEIRAFLGSLTAKNLKY